jgi:hypothetical protein
MHDLFARTLSEGLQAFMPIAVWMVWLRRSGRSTPLSAARLGLVAALPLTAIAGWLFQSSSYQARWESPMAIGATAIVFASGWSVWRRIAVPESRSSGAASMLWKVALAAATALVVVRQTMVMAAVFGAAAIQMRSLDATAVVSVLCRSQIR